MDFAYQKGMNLLNGDGGNENHRKRTGSGRKSAGKKRSARTSSSKRKNSKAAKPARRRRIIIKKQFDFSTEVSQELAPAKTRTPEASSLISEPAPYFDEKYADAKYLSHRKVGDHYYSIYIMPCGPAPRDALMMLNYTSNDRSGAVYLTYENEEQDELRIRAASSILMSYIYKKCGLLRLFFTRTRENYPLTSVILRPAFFREELTMQQVFEIISGKSETDLFCTLLECLHTFKMMPYEILQYAMRNRENFYTYMEGASYAPPVKAELIALYESCSLGDSRKPSLKSMLLEFLSDYYEEYEICFESVRDIVEKDLARMKSQVETYGELLNVTDHYLFRRMLMGGPKEQSVCLEKLAFTAGTIEYFCNRGACIISIGHGRVNPPGNHMDYERIGDKLKNFSDIATKKILDALANGPCSLETIMAATGLNRDAAYRMTSLLTEQKVIQKIDGTNEYVLNKKHLMKLIRILEKYGGIR